MCRRSVEAGMPCARSENSRFDGKTTRSSAPSVSTVSGWKLRSAFSTVSDRSMSKSSTLASQMWRKVFHL
jgi:hypothetical protein